MHLQTVLYVVDTAHRGDAVQQAVDLVTQDRPTEDHTPLLGPDLNGAGVADKPTQLRPHTFG
jgi:hypothetical protein